jgi:seryl-tRNA synthetase
MRPTKCFALLSCSLALTGLLAASLSATADDNKNDQNAKQAIRVHLKDVRVKATNKNNEAWDVNNGRPDIMIRVKNLTDQSVPKYESGTRDDVLIATFDNAAINAMEGHTIQIDVIDSDVASNDTIGTATFVLSSEACKKGSADLSFDQVESLKLELEKR